MCTPRCSGPGAANASWRRCSELIDAPGEPSYLETTKPDNVAYYEALGYDSVGAPVALGGPSSGPWVFPMRRSPVGDVG